MDALIIAYSEGSRMVCLAGFDRGQAQSTIAVLRDHADKLPELARTCEAMLYDWCVLRKQRLGDLSVKINVADRGIVTAAGSPLTGRVIQLLMHACRSPNTGGRDTMVRVLERYARGGPGGVHRPFKAQEFQSAIIIP